MTRLTNVLVAFAFVGALSACSVSDDGANPAPPPREGFTLSVIAEEGEQIYMVTHTDGRAAAARVAGATSEIIEPTTAEARIEERLGVLGESDTPVQINFPGFSLSVASQDRGEGKERARIAINAGGQEVLIDADDTNTGGAARDDGADRAAVRIPGVNEEAARNFITEAEHMSAETKAEMLRLLNLTS